MNYLFKPSKSFRKDIKKIYPNKNQALKKLKSVFGSSHRTEKKLRHHKLHGQMKNLYACHLKPDLVIIYKEDKKNKIIYLLRIGSHSHLFK